MLYVLFQLILALPAQAQNCNFAQTIYGPLRFNQVDIVSRVDWIGDWRGGDIILKPWIAISENAYLGIDQQGRVINILKLGDRTVGLLLSGERKIKDLFLRSPGQLMALDQNNQLFGYQTSQWTRSPLSKIVRRSLTRLGYAACSVGLSVLALSWIQGTNVPSTDILIALGLGSVTGALLEVWRASADFIYLNDRPDGFVPIGIEVANFRRADPIWNGEGRIVDYDLGQGRSLQFAVKQAQFENGNFDVSCERELLARALPPSVHLPAVFE